MIRTARCPCAQLSITTEGDPSVVVACNCTNCQRKSGSVINVVATFSNAQVLEKKGKFKSFGLLGESGRKSEINFCPECGTSVYWQAEIYEDSTSIAVGCFADPTFPKPVVSLWNKSKHDWVQLSEEIPCLETQLSAEQVNAKLEQGKNA